MSLGEDMLISFLTPPLLLLPLRVLLSLRLRLPTYHLESPSSTFFFLGLKVGVVVLYFSVITREQAPSLYREERETISIGCLEFTLREAKAKVKFSSLQLHIVAFTDARLQLYMERIRVGEELLDAKRIEEENERKCVVASRKAEKEEEKRAREKIRQKLEEDKAERRRKLGLPPEDPVAAKPSAPAVEEKKSLVPVRPATKAEQMRECLRSLKQNHKDNEAKVKMAFNTLLTYARNVATNTNEEKFRKIRLSNATFQARVGALKGGIKFLELCGFKKIDGGEFLFLPRDKVDMAVLNSAGTELNSAINNPFFGVL
ncbi:UBX domain-containing protein 1-like isoform X3 [Camellia sinensis]|uniref:UBX domain-containing protein 1-like isoform X3 n=1 Tax=Camellia sinensis TaxID=4442 RepID=UPI001036E379|nr:UBX domain-containing protein 1-like isoform X3 [Camellia sinensis]XP_028090280.1 UBX domain-containing protein 1-like isoform X3 [Camellia sinensis]